MAEAIFTGDPGFAQCHASSVAQVPGGFLAAWFGGTKEGDRDTAIWLARHGAGAWSPPRRRFKLVDQPHWNPVLFAAPDGRVHLWFKVGADCAVWRTWHSSSDDGGETWAEARPFLGDDALARGPVRCQPIVAGDGAWLAGASDERVPDADGRMWWPYIDRSTDGGRSWIAQPIRLAPGTPPGKGGIQPTLWCSPTGAHCLLRTGLGAIYRSDSGDGGRTWGDAYPTGLPNNNSGIAVARLADGTLALAWNPVAGDWAARTPLRLSLSGDDGRTWDRHFDLASGPGEFSYPAVIADGGRITVTWTDRRARIAWWSGLAADIPRGEALAAQAQAR